MGFVIFRCTYDNDALWDAFIAVVKASAAFCLRMRKQQDILGPDLECTVVEDREAFNGASKNAVRERFRAWVAARSVERDGEGIYNPDVEELPRFRYCVYVDRACLKAVRVSWSEIRFNYFLCGQIVVINAAPGDPPIPPDSDEEDEDENDDCDDVYEEVEGSTAKDVGWTYASASLLVETYEELHLRGSEWETWEMIYKRPSPDGPAVQEGEHLLDVGLTREA
ncbi:hypothetical protein GGTG_01286 [Gaeumannomyces tritici R3-111a-1]|uniref:Uncharacterized protein n=1 Tax=Gaeumannomyces tritici (strain R3-111a-1) TaxID=644352 RepID=J3NJ53_GAET3|nr:hypothetical protein GGTG_01286 [Gaeumannomyces tritici R3-111a-1]EJT81303.1 hypothetical protein GGTG_01286 [Gaeumannomyces tritici R3-111a-1]